MSLVNEMLRDLELRQGDKEPTVLVSPSDSSKMRLGYRWLLLCGLLAITYLAYSLGRNYAQAPAAVAIQVEVPRVANLTPAAAELPVALQTNRPVDTSSAVAAANIDSARDLPNDRVADKAEVLPQAELLTATFLKTNVPQTNFPNTNFPNTNFPNTNGTQTDVPQTKVSQTKVSQAKVSQTKVSQTVVSQTIASQVATKELPAMTMEKTDGSAAALGISRVDQRESSAAIDALQQARAAVSLGALTEAAALVEPWLDQPAYKEHRILAAALYQQLGEYRKSARLYSGLLVDDRERDSYWLGLAVALDSLNEGNAARDAFVRARQYAGQSIDRDLQRYIDLRISTLTQ